MPARDVCVRPCTCVRVCMQEPAKACVHVMQAQQIPPTRFKVGSSLVLLKTEAMAVFEAERSRKVCV